MGEVGGRAGIVVADTSVATGHGVVVEEIMEQMFTREQVIAGIKLAQAWYEGHSIETLDPEQLIEAIEKALHSADPA